MYFANIVKDAYHIQINEYDLSCKQPRFSGPYTRRFFSHVKEPNFAKASIGEPNFTLALSFGLINPSVARRRKRIQEPNHLEIRIKNLAKPNFNLKAAFKVFRFWLVENFQL